MKPIQSPSVRQILVYDISSQRFVIFSIFLGIPSLGLLMYGALSKAYLLAGIGFFCLLMFFWFIARLIGRIRFFQTIYQNGEMIASFLSFVSTTGDEIFVRGEYTYKDETYCFSTTFQKTKRTKDLAVGDQIYLVVDQDKPGNVYAQDLFTPDSPSEIRQHLLSNQDKKKSQELISKNKMEESDTYRIKVSGQATDNQYPSQSLVHSVDTTKPYHNKLTVHDFPRGFSLLGGIMVLAGMIIYIRAGNWAVEIGIFGLLLLLFSLSLCITIIIDKDAGTMSIKSIWSHQGTEICLKELSDIQVESKEGDDGTTYRLVAIKTDGNIIPFRRWYTIGLSSYRKRAIQLCNFIGLGNEKTP